MARRTLTIELDLASLQTPRELARALEQIARSVRAMPRLEHRDEGVSVDGARVGRLVLDAGQVGLFGAAAE